MIRSPGSQRGNLVIDSIQLTPLFRAGFTFAGQSGTCKVIAVSKVINPAVPAVSYPVYTVQKGDGTKVDCQSRHILKATGPIPATNVALIRMDDRDWMVFAGAPGRLAATEVCKSKDNVDYQDEFGITVTHVLLKALVYLALEVGELPYPEDKLAPPPNCWLCGARRRLVKADQIQGDAGATAPSTGTWDKEGPYKNHEVCAWTGEANHCWQEVQDKKNWAFKNSYRPPQASIKDVGGRDICHGAYMNPWDSRGFYSPQPSFKAFSLKRSSEDLYWVSIPGWDLELVGANCTL